MPVFEISVCKWRLKKLVFLEKKDFSFCCKVYLFLKKTLDTSPEQYKYSKTPFIRINWGGESSRNAEKS
jgi:hypothetical protein